MQKTFEDSPSGVLRSSVSTDCSPEDSSHLCWLKVFQGTAIMGGSLFCDAVGWTGTKKPPHSYLPSTELISVEPPVPLDLNIEKARSDSLNGIGGRAGQA